MGAETVAEEACYVWAIKIQERGEVKVILRHSVLLTPDDPLLNPVRRELDKQCSTLDVERTEEDPGYMFGEVVVLEWHLMTMCPGADVEHRCVKEMATA